MANLLNTQTLELFLLFVVPGFVAMKIHDLLVPSKARSWGDALVEAISYSMLNLALLFWLVGLLQRPGFQGQHPIIYGIGVFFVLFVAPVGWAVLVRALCTSKFLRKYVLHPSPSAWDYFFAQRQSVWVLAYLKSGRRIGGLFSAQSYAATFPNEEDLLLEEVWKIDDEGRFIERIEQTSGALIKRADCSHIELFKTE